MNKIFALLPCYNESLNIKPLIEDWLAQSEKLNDDGYELTIIGIDDYSSDNTKQIIADMAKECSAVKLVAHEVNKGLCGGLNTAISYFLENGTENDLMVLMDGDNTHNPMYVHNMIQKMKQGASCVIASRYCSDSSIVGVAKHREFLSDMAKVYYSAVLRVKNVKDYTCGYRLYTYPIIKNLVLKFGDEPIKEKSFACMMELLYKVHKCGATFAEVGFKLRYDNKQGESKMRVFKTIYKSLTTALKLRFIKE